MDKILLLLALMLLLASCASETNQPLSWTTIEGYVLDSLTGTPIDSAVIYTRDTLVHLPDSSVIDREPLMVTDSTGHYLYKYEGSGGTILIVRKEGYYTKIKEIIPTGDDQVIKGIDFNLTK